jgi:tripeptidyl-peptidase-1
MRRVHAGRSQVAKLNAARLAAGKATMGFINPWLYASANAGSVYDVTAGDNCDTDPPNSRSKAFDGAVGAAVAAASGGGGDGCNSTYGYLATVGWDPVTGLGTPNYEALERIALHRLREG